MKINKIIQGDCLEVMKEMEDNSVDLVLTDPPYGIGASNDSRMSGFYTVNLGGKKTKVQAKNYKKSDWDSFKPTKEYFDEIIRISKNQIIFGGNYFIEYLKNSSCWLVWDKMNGENNNADCELAWTSFKTAVRKHSFKWNGMLQQDMKNKEYRYHPTQKPLEVMKWILQNYSKEGDLVFDGFAGSGSTLIACEQLNRKWIGVEKNEYYVKDIKYRLSNIQQTLI